MKFANLCIIKNFLNSIRANRNDNFSKEPFLISFSSYQQVILNLLDQHVSEIQSSNSINILYKRCVVQGKAGSGKSTLIHEIVRKVKISLREDSIFLAALTIS